MRQVSRCAALLTALVPMASARSQLVPVAPFIGAHREGFEGTFPPFFHPQLVCFDGAATANQLGGTLGLNVVTGFGTPCGTMQQHSGIWLLAPWLDVNVEWIFERPAARFGGYFGTICQDPGATAEFYDESGVLMAAMPMTVPTAGQWAWNGWKATGPGFKRVRIIATDLDGHVMHDDMELDFVGDCYADCDKSGALSVADFSCFQSSFVAADPRADCNASGVLTIADFACFQTAFVQGCP
jgi:hypothetical protein